MCSVPRTKRRLKRINEEPPPQMRVTLVYANDANDHAYDEALHPYLPFNIALVTSALSLRRSQRVPGAFGHYGVTLFEHMSLC
jgi:hypothetical protein